MLHDHVTVVAPFAVLRAAAALTGAYLLWLVVFERWAEPAMRRLAGALFRGPIDWGYSSGPFRTWWLRGNPSPGRAGAVAMACNVCVAGCAFVPALAGAWLLGRPAGDESVAASAYLMTPALTGVFALRVLWHRAQAP